MTTEMAFHNKRALHQGKDVRNMMDNLYPMDQTLVLNSLRDLSVDDIRDTGNLWRLIKAALSAVRALQKDLNAANAALAEKNARIEYLEQIATTDELTGLLNRRGFMDVFEKEIDRTNRDLTKGGLLIMIDMDNFKSINDTYGHAAGDQALRLVAQTLQAHIRKMDFAARLGGDEFVLLFSNAHCHRIADRAQNFLRKLNSLTLKYNGERIPVRASLGLQSYAKGDSMDTIFNKADALMYKEKDQKKHNA